jgi:diaminopimelate epimerase
MKISFTKLTGAGNDFVAIDNMGRGLTVDKNRLSRALCDRHFGVGADGILVLEPSADADFAMLYYNADGSFGGMCGNGGRCSAVFAHANGIAGTTMRFEALGHIYRAEILDNGVRLWMKDPVVPHKSISVDSCGRPWVCHPVDTGSPHVVVFTNDLAGIPVAEVGRALREHASFAPAGTNVNFVQALGSGDIAMRTYERGVESETLACGTGSVASSIIACLEHGMKPPVRVHAFSGDTLIVNFRIDGGKISDVVLEGPALSLFSGKTLYDDASGRIRESS